jgi:hypothetical protein
VELDVDTVSVDDAPEVSVAGEKLAVAPDGRPVAEKVIDCGVPTIVVVEIADVVDVPGLT